MKTHLDNEERAAIAALAALGKSPHAIGKAISRDPKTCQKALGTRELQEMVQEAQERLGLKFQELAENILDAVTGTDLEKASLQQKTISAATMLDKARLALGMTTENIGVRGVIIQTDCKELADLLNGG